MSEHEKETAFLHHCICYDESPGRQALTASLARIECDERCVRRGIWIMSLIALLAMAVFCYSSILIETLPQDTSHVLVKILAPVGLASAICLLVFMGLRMIYRARLDERREECRQLIMKLLVSRLGQPVSLSPRDKEGGVLNFAGRLNQPVSMSPQNNGSN